MNIRNLLIATFASALVPTGSISAPGSQEERRMAEPAGDQRLSYWLYLPEGVEEAEEGSVPLILFLHGAGERGADLERVKAHGPPKLVGKGSPLDGSIVVSPQCPENSWWRTGALKALLDEVIAAHPAADPSRFYITGLSMGGYGTWGMLAEYPDLFAGAIPICGGGDINRRRRGGGAERPSTFSLDRLLRAKGVPIWAFHGDKDTAVPVGESILLVDALKEAGAKSVRLTVYEGVGHDSWTRTYGDPKVWGWLLDQRKK